MGFDGKILIALVTAYLIGAVPFGLFVARTQGVDLRAVGSGNIGATNVFRSVGKPWGLLTFALDFLKGFFPACFFAKLFGLSDPQAVYGLIFGSCAILGHNFPIFLKFKGGKGVATSAGVVLAVAPLSVLLGLAGFALCVKLTGFVSLGSMLAATLIAASGWFFYSDQGFFLPLSLTLLALLVFVRHRTNIERLLNGTEARVGKSKTMKNNPKPES